MLKDVFVFAECQGKTTFGLGYKLILKRIKDNVVIDKTAGIADPRIKTDHIHWYVPHYTRSIQQQTILTNQILKKLPTELRYIERSVFMNEIKNQKLWIFELGSQESMDIPIWIDIGSQQQDRQDSYNLNNDTFCRLPVVSAQCLIGTDKFPDAGVSLNYDDDDDYVQGYHQIIEAFRASTKNFILQPYISEDDFISSNVRPDDVGYNLNIFGERYQKKH